VTPTESTRQAIVVVGSINIDLVARVPRRPDAGETLAADSFTQTPGGKGANQAVAAARLGAPTWLVGRVGDDAFADPLRDNLRRHGVQLDHVLPTPDCSSGLALIHVDRSGENAITIVAGANARLTPADVDAAADRIARAAIVVLQLEVPLATAARAAQLAREHGVPVLLDPAPAPGQPLLEPLRRVDFISPNQTEAATLTGERVESTEEAVQAARKLIQAGAARVVLKLGSRGVLLLEGPDAEPVLVPAFNVDPVDTTGAGDAFTAGLAVGLAEGLAPADAARLGCAAGALATTRHGAQNAMPSREEADRLLQAR